MRIALTIFVLLSLGTTVTTVAHAGTSECFGTVAKGRLVGGVQLPASGANFTAYSTVGVRLGRTHVHSQVGDVIVAAYAALERTAPGTVFVYGESGWASGGRIRPHATHQNGLSVDFMVPVVNSKAKPVPLSTSIANKYGYGVEFDRDGRYGEYWIDFRSLAEHLYQLHRAAESHGIGISLVIFDPPYLPRLFATPRGPYLKQHLTFMQGKAWWRHDEHYHVDFAVRCKPIPRLSVGG